MKWYLGRKLSPARPSPSEVRANSRVGWKQRLSPPRHPQSAAHLLMKYITYLPCARHAAMVIQIFTKLKEVRLVFKKLTEGPKV